MTTPHLTVDSASIYMFHLMSEHSRYQALVSEMKLNSNWGSHFHTFSLQSSSELASRKWTKLVLNDFLNYYCCKMCLLGMKRCAECTWNVYFFFNSQLWFHVMPVINRYMVCEGQSKLCSCCHKRVCWFVYLDNNLCLSGQSDVLIADSVCICQSCYRRVWSLPEGFIELKASLVFVL